MYIVLLVSLMSTFLLLNIMFSEYVEARINVYKDAGMEERDRVRLKLKYTLIIIMSVFWAWYLI